MGRGLSSPPFRIVIVFTDFILVLLFMLLMTIRVDVDEVFGLMVSMSCSDV